MKDKQLLIFGFVEQYIHIHIGLSRNVFILREPEERNLLLNYQILFNLAIRTALKYFYINHGDQRFFLFEIVIHVFPHHLNTCVIRLWAY